MQKRDEFDSAGEALGYISLDQAVLEARRLVRQDQDRYLDRLKWGEIVWTESGSERREDSYRVVLGFQRPTRGTREEQTGEEEFIFDLTGQLKDRQVLLWPERVAADEGPLPSTPARGSEVPTLQIPEVPSPLEGAVAATGPAHQPKEADQPSAGRAYPTTTVPGVRSPTSRTFASRIVTHTITRSIAGAVLVSWSALMAAGGGTTVSEERVSAKIVLFVGAVVTAVAGGLLLGWNRRYLNRLRIPKLALWLSIAGIVVSVVGIGLTGP